MKCIALVLVGFFAAVLAIVSYLSGAFAVAAVSFGLAILLAVVGLILANHGVDLVPDGDTEAATVLP